MLKYRDKEYIPPEQTVLDLLNLFLPLLEDNIEEEAWSICIGDGADDTAKDIVQDINRNVRQFLNRYQGQLQKIASDDPLLKNQEALNSMNSSEIGQYLSDMTQVRRRTG